MKKKIFISISVFLAIGLLVFNCKKVEKPLDSKLRLFSRLFDRLINQEQVAGAQVVIGQNNQILYEEYFGKLNVEVDLPVNSETMFCIGSCSKTFTGVIIMALVNDGILKLDIPIDKWLPQFSTPRITGIGLTERAPTVRELLCHRSGIYSQKRSITEKQMNLIRKFSLTLEQSVDEIAKEELIFQPGTDYAYSGAAYCVLGRVAEVASGKAFEELLQEKICQPLDLIRTTYFPSLDDGNIALGIDSNETGLVPNRHAPHLLESKHRFPLIGGSIYSTAGETALFAQMVLNHGRTRSKRVISEEAWLEMTSPHADIQVGYYGLGWLLDIRNEEERPWRISHNGRLSGYNSIVRIYLDNGFFFVAHWTGPASKAVREAIEETLSQLVS